MINQPKTEKEVVWVCKECGNNNYYNVVCSKCNYSLNTEMRRIFASITGQGIQAGIGNGKHIQGRITLVVIRSNGNGRFMPYVRVMVSETNIERLSPKISYPFCLENMDVFLNGNGNKEGLKKLLDLKNNGWQEFLASQGVNLSKK